jgi:nitrate reductase delta subunit
MSSPFATMQSFRRPPDHFAAIDRVRDWTRQRFKLTADATIMVSQIACAVPGCPPIETVAVFWTAAGRHHFKVFKPVAEVVEDDLPPAFMKDALVAPDSIECSCC